MKRMTDRRTVLIAAGAAAITTVADAAASQSTDVSGTVEFEGGSAIPKGHIEIYPNDPAIRDGAQLSAARPRFKSNGGSKTVDFSLSLSAESITSPTLQIVARLERADGWLIARGSTKFQAGSPLTITLNTAMY